MYSRIESKNTCKTWFHEFEIKLKDNKYELGVNVDS